MSDGRGEVFAAQGISTNAHSTAAPASVPWGLVVLWDRDCGFCAVTVALLLRLDTRGVLRPRTIQDSEAEGLLDDVAPQLRYASWHAVDAAGALTSGGAALTDVLARLPALRALARVTARLPRLTERAYAWVATHRDQLARPIPAAATRRARRLVEARARAPSS